jgi:hypothetical protein
MEPERAAALLVAMIEGHGGTFTITPDGYLRADLDPIPLDQMPGDPEVLIEMILGYSDRIKDVLRSRKTLH